MSARPRHPAADLAPSPTPPGEPLPAGPPAWIDPALIAAAFAALAAASWGRWADPFIDFGREIYVAWRLAAGETLYRDVAYFNGPLSPHINALLMRAAGVSTSTLYAANLAVAATIAALLLVGLRRLFGRVAAVAGTAFFLGVFAFAQQLTVASFNFVAPYSHEMTHGTLLALVALAALHRWTTRGGAAAAAVAGVALGLLLLGKPEFALAAGGALLVGWATSWWAGVRTPRQLATALALALAGAALPPAVAWMAVRDRLGAGGASEAILGAWRYLDHRGVRELAFYRYGMGVDTPWRNLGSAALWAVGIGVSLALGWLIARMCRGRRDRATALAFLLAPGSALFLLREELAWTSFARPLPFVLAGAALVQLVALQSERRAGAVDSRRPVRLALTVFALLLLLKMALNTRFHQYGFALAMPGAVLAVAWLVGDAPKAIGAAESAARWFRLWSLSLVLAVLAVHLAISASVWRTQTATFRRDGDFLVADAQARMHALIAERLEARLPPRATLAVLPEGVMVNFLNRRLNPTPFVNFMPPELLLFGEPRIVDAFRAAPPDYLLLLNRDAADYGMGMLGRDHGRELMAWVQASYEPIDEIREPSSVGRYFSYGLLLRRRAAPTG